MDTMENHIRTIRNLLYIFSFLGLIGAVFITLFMMAISCDSQSSITIQCILIGGAIGLSVLMFYSILPFAIGIGLKKKTPFIFRLFIVYSLLIILYIPIGTALGVYFIWGISKFRAEL